MTTTAEQMRKLAQLLEHTMIQPSNSSKTPTNAEFGDDEMDNGMDDNAGGNFNSELRQLEAELAAEMKKINAVLRTVK